MDGDRIRALLPHRAPFLLVDRVEELEPGSRAVGYYRVTGDEPWFRGHFPGDPILPGVLVAEALAQVGGLLYLSADPAYAGSTVYLVGMDRLRFRRVVRPGEELRLEVRATGRKRRIWLFDGAATVAGDRAAEGSFMATIRAGG